MLIIILNYKNFSKKIILIQLKLNFRKKATYSVRSNPSQYIYNKNHNSSTHVFRDVILYATLRGCISVGDALIAVWFSLLGLSYSVAYTCKVLKKFFFSCAVDFKALSNIFPMVVYPRFMSLLVYPTGMYTRMKSLQVYPMAVYPKFISLLAYPTALYIHYWA